MISLAFAGNPNTGKSALINAIAGSKLQVGNWPGVTVEKKEACFYYKNEKITMVDLPGVYSLSPFSIEEIVTRNFIINEKPDIIINVVDSTNLERNLYLTYLLKELNIPMILALNFTDSFERLNYKLDFIKFSELIGIKAYPVSALKQEGLDELMDGAINLANEHKKADFKLSFSNDISEIIENLRDKIILLPRCDELLKLYDARYVAIKLLEDDEHILSVFKDKFTKNFWSDFVEIKARIEDRYKDDTSTVLAEQRYGALNGVLKLSLEKSVKNRLDVTEKIDQILLNRFLGLPLFFAIIAGLMAFVFNGSAPLIDFVDSFFANFVGKYVGIWVSGTPDWVASMAVDGIVAGVGGVLTFVPLMAFLYFFLAILEESGYMNRVAFLMDKIMRRLGLNGKAFVPMVIGFGCNVPAIYATRTLEDEKSRKLTACMVPFMSCGARLPVYALFTAAFFGAKAGIVVVLLYLIGIFTATFLGLILKRFSGFKVDTKALLIELPPYHMPSLSVIFRSTWNRLWLYIKKAATAILAVLILLWALAYFPNSGDAKTSYIASFGKALQPILAPTGFATRWETAAVVVPSIAAKEVVVGFMAQILPIANQSEELKQSNNDILADLKEQGVSLIFALRDSIKGVFSLNISSIFTPPSQDELVEEKGSGVIMATKKLWDDDLAPLRALSFMVFILLVVPCIVTLAAIKQEFGWKFMAFVSGITIIIPYVASTLVFWVGRVFF